MKIVFFFNLLDFNNNFSLLFNFANFIKTCLFYSEHEFNFLNFKVLSNIF